MSKSIPFDKGNFTVVPNRKILEGMDPKAQVVHFWLADMANEDNQCWPGYDALAKKSGLKRNATIEAVKILVKAGLVKKERRQVDSNGSISNLYTLLARESTKSTPPSPRSALPSPSNGLPPSTEQTPPVHDVDTNYTHRTIPNELYTSTNVDVQPTASPPKTSRPLFLELVQILGFSDKTLYSDKRRGKLSSRLKQYSADDLKTAATALANDAFMQGDNPGGKRWGTIDYLLRSDEIVEKYLLNQPVGAANKELYDDNGNYIGGWDNATGGSGHV